MISRAQRKIWKIGLWGSLVLSLAATHKVEATPTAAAVKGTPLTERSAGVFIGIEKFSYDFSLVKVNYAVDDAVDLAYSLSIERGLLPPNRVLLLLAGEPSKEDSQARLNEMIEKRAAVKSAKQADIYSLVQAQSKQVGEGGIFVLSIATHGFSEGDEHLLMAEDSILQFRTGITAEKLFEATQTRSKGLRLLFVDACRGQIESGRGLDPRSAMRIERVQALAERPGYIVFSAASAGEIAYSDKGNGLFTGAILKGLRCENSDKKEGIPLAELVSLVTTEVQNESNFRQTPELRSGGGVVDLILPPCQAGSVPISIPVPPEILQKIREAASYAGAGGPENFETSFWLYRKAFQDMPVDVLASLNQGLVDRARKIEESSQRAESVRIYGQLLHPLLAQARTNTN